MSLYEANEVWIPLMGARVLDDIAFKVMLEQIRADLGPGASVTGSISRVLVTVQTDAKSAEKALMQAKTKIAEVMRDRPFIIDGTTPRTAVDLG
jgi:hypothetical protein